MGRPKKNKLPETVQILNEDGQPQDMPDVGVPGLFQPQEWDIAEELQNNEALRDYHRDMADLN